MYLSRHQTEHGANWALDGYYLPDDFTMSKLLSMSGNRIGEYLKSLSVGEYSQDPLLAPLEPMQEVWACGVTYLRSREARENESAAADVYAKVYKAERPELFYKSTGWRVVAHRQAIRIRRDSLWNVPEPELTLVINADLEIVGYCVGNDVSSRDIEGQNPLYLPQAKIYNGSCALGPGIEMLTDLDLQKIPIALNIYRDGNLLFQSETSTAKMKRKLNELVVYLGSELDFPQGVYLMTGTGIVPPDKFSLQVDDVVSVTVGELSLTNTVVS